VKLKGLLAMVAWLGLSTPGTGASLPAGEPLFERFGIEQGLPSTALNAIAQDEDGYLWIGSADGLARFDGLDFEVWRAGGGERSIPGNEVQALATADDGALWLAFEDRGIARLDPRTLRLTHFPPGQGGAPANDVWSILGDEEGGVWLGTWQEGLVRFHPAKGRLAAFRHDPADPESLPSDIVIQLRRGRDGSLLIATAAGLARLRDPQSGRFEVIRHAEGDPATLSADLVLGVHEDPDGTLWIGTSGGLDRLSGGRLLRQSDPAHPLAALPPLRAQAIQRARDGSLWIGAQDGVVRLSGAHAARYRGEEERRFAFPPAGVFQIVEDHEGGLWFATRGGGLARLKPTWSNFAVFRHRAGEAASLPAPVVHAIAEDGRGGLWVATARGGLWRLDRESGRGERVTEDIADWPDLTQLSLAAGSDGVLWVGFHNGLGRFDPGRRRLDRALLGVPGRPPRGAYSLLIPAGEGAVWAAVYGVGLFRISPAFEVLQAVLPGGAEGLRDADFEQIGRGPDGGLWVAGGSGLFRLGDPSGRAPLAVIDDGRVFAFDVAADGSLWAVLEDRLVRIGADGRRESFGTESGYPVVRAGSLFVGADGRVWVATPRGLFAFDAERRSLAGFGTGDGLPTVELSQRPGWKAADGSLWIGSQDGLIGFDPRRLRRPAVPPPLLLRELSVIRSGQRIALDPKAARLQAGDRELLVRARALSFLDPRANRYRFRLAGLDEEWIETLGLGEQLFPRLPAGRYVLEIAAESAFGVPAREVLAIPLSVAPPFWQTGTAWAIYLLLLALLLAGFHLAWKRRLLRRHALDLERQRRMLAEQASQAKTDFLAMVGHEIRTPLTGVMGMAELLGRQPIPEESRRFAEAIRRSGELLLRLIEDLLVWSRIEVGKLAIELRPFDLEALLAHAVEVERPQALRKGLALGLALDPRLRRWWLGDPLRIEQIVLNLLHNAVKYTQRGRVDLRADIEGERVVVRVRDTGPGIAAEERERLFRRFERGRTPPAAPGHGLGLAIARELVERMGGTIELTSEPGQGAEFIVRLPLAPAEPPAGSRGDALAPVRRVLLVEDDPVVRQTLLAMLSTLEVETVAVPHALLALAEAEKTVFDLVLIDLDLPAVDGFECARLLRELTSRLGRRPPRLVAITARREAEAEGCRRAGLEGPVQKPVTLAALRAVLGPSGL
jgi:signal transduction histidine kinase/streptogramin lyase